MTYCTRELVERGVDTFVRDWRKWRRSMRLTIAEAAACAGVSRLWLQEVETGRSAAGPRTRAKLGALMQRWDESKRPKRGPERRGAHLRKQRTA